jgi:uncharacterized protein YndB with AHSA1/START domain
MEGGIAILGFWLFIISLVMKKPLMSFIEKSKAGGANNAQLMQRLQQLESLSQTMAKDLLEIKQLLQAQSTDGELLKLKDSLEDEQDEHTLPLIDGSSANLGTVIDKNTVRFERLLPGSVEQVWQYLSQPDRISEWLATANLEPRVGGRVELNFDTEEMPERKVNGARIRGLVSRFEAPHTLAYSWIDTQTALESNVLFELTAQGDETMLVLTHSRLPEDRMHEVMAGWHTHLEVLIARLKDLVPPDFAKTFQQLLPIYSAMVVTVVVSAAPASAAINNESFHTIQTERTHLLTKYDNHWRDADELEREIVRLKHVNSPDESQTIDRLDKQLKDEYRDLHQIELDIRELDKAAM